MAIALHDNNMQRWSPSILARSIHYFGRATGSLLSNETHQRRPASGPITMDTLHEGLLSVSLASSPWALVLLCGGFGYFENEFL